MSALARFLVPKVLDQPMKYLKNTIISSKLCNCWRLRTLRWTLLFLQDFQFSGHLLFFVFWFFSNILKFYVHVTNPIPETACCLESWLWLYKVAYFYCVYPGLCICAFELKYDRSSVIMVQWTVTKNKGNWTAKHQFPMHTKCFHAS